MRTGAEGALWDVLETIVDAPSVTAYAVPPPFTQGRLTYTAVFATVVQICKCRKFQRAFSHADNIGVLKNSF